MCSNRITAAQVVMTARADKALDRAPIKILRAFEIWARLIESHGTRILRGFAGYHDEKLKGIWKGCRSSRLDRQWRVIYRVSRSGTLEVVSVEQVTAHDYRKK